MTDEAAGTAALSGQSAALKDFAHSRESDDVSFPDPRLHRIPRGPVFGTGVLGQAKSARWPRVDEQGDCLYTTNGRAAILLGLDALGVGRGDQVLLPTYHCPTMVDAVVRLGAEPIFYPIKPSGDADVDNLRRLNLTRVKALLVAHFFGLPQDLGPARQFCDDLGLALIEDCAHAFFGRSALGAFGSVGDMAIGSLTKFFPLIEGGCLVMRKPAGRLPVLGRAGLANQLRTVWDAFELGATAGRLGPAAVLMSTLVRLKHRIRARGPIEQVADLAEPDLSTVFDTIDLAKVKRRPAAFVTWLVRHADSERIVNTRRANYLQFARLLSGQARMRPLFAHLPEDAAPYVFPLDVDDPDEIYRALRRRGVPMYRWDILWPGTPVLPGDATARWSHHVLQLACHQDMTEADVGAVADAIRDECELRPT